MVRTTCYLWESFTGNRLTDLPEVGGPTVPEDVFDYIEELVVQKDEGLEEPVR